MATAQQLVIAYCEDRKKKNITRSPSSPGDGVRCCIRNQEAGQNEFEPCAHSNRSHTHPFWHAQPQSHAPLHSAAAPPASALSHSPAKTSTARETCLETEGKLPPRSDWLSSLATACVWAASQAPCGRHTDPMKQIIPGGGQAQWPGNSQEEKSGRWRGAVCDWPCRVELSSDWFDGLLSAIIHTFSCLAQAFLHPSPLGSTSERPPCPEGNRLPKVNAERCWSPIGWAEREQNLNLVTSPHVTAGLKPV